MRLMLKLIVEFGSPLWWNGCATTTYTLERKRI